MTKTQPVFFLSNTNRKDKFLIETRIWDKDSVLQAEKKALTADAQKHLDGMFDTYKALSDLKKISSIISIVAPVKSSQQNLIFDFIKGVSAERALLEKLLAEDKQGTYDIIDKLFLLIDSLPSVKANPANNSEYAKVFGKTFNKIQDCTTLGIIDLNLNNVIIDKNNQWHLYDYEWAFDFPIPKQLLRLRFLWYFVYRHREILRYHAQRINSVSVRKNIYMPKFLYERYKEVFKDFDDLRLAESGFQYYLTGKEDGKLTAFKDGEFAVETASPPVVGIESSINKATEKIAAQLRAERQQRTAAEKQKAALEQKLNAITSSKSYRLASRLARLRHKILPK